MIALLSSLLLASMAVDGAPALVPPPYMDARIRTIVYDPREVVPLSVAPGYQLTVDLGGGEQIENIAIGDSNGWLVTPNKRGDFFFIKPLDGARPTDLTVITQARTFLFELSPGGGPAAFAVKFEYPAPVDEAGNPALPTAPSGKYRLSGAADLRPLAIFDDGAKTYVVLKPDHPLPAIFAVDAGGKETLLNGAMRDGRYVIDSVANTLVLRLDREAVLARRKPRLKN